MYIMRKTAPFDKASLLLSPLETKRREQMKIYNNSNPDFLDYSSITIYNRVEVSGFIMFCKIQIQYLGGMHHGKLI